MVRDDVHHGARRRTPWCAMAYTMVRALLDARKMQECYAAVVGLLRSGEVCGVLGVESR